MCHYAWEVTRELGLSSAQLIKLIAFCHSAWIFYEPGGSLVPNKQDVWVRLKFLGYIKKT